RILVFEPNPKRAAIALQLGAAVNLEGERARQVKQIMDLTDGLGVDVAIDCAGKAGSVNLCIESVRPGGVVGVPSVHPGPMEIDIRTVTPNPSRIAGPPGSPRGAGSPPPRVSRGRNILWNAW